MILLIISLIFNFCNAIFTKSKLIGSLGGSGKHGRLKIYAHILGYRFKSDSEYMYCEPVSLITTSTKNIFSHYHHSYDTTITMLFFYKIIILLYLYLVFCRATLQFKGIITVKRVWDIAIIYFFRLFNYLSYTYEHMYCKGLLLCSTFARSLVILRIRALLHNKYIISNYAFQQVS